MKRLPVIMLLLLLASAICAQEKVEYVDDESCGCELVFVDGIQTTTDGDRFGFKRQDGSIISPNKYKYVDKFHGRYCKVYHSDDSCGMIDRDGFEIVPCEYTDVSYPADGMFLVQQNGRYGHIDTNGRLRVPIIYRTASTFSEGLAVVAVDIDSTLVQYGYIDYDNHIVIQPQYEYAYPFSEGFAVIKNYDRYGMINRKNQEVLPVKYEVATSVREGLFLAGDDEGLALFDTRFKPLTRFVYDNLAGFTEKRILIQRDGKYGYLDPKGREVVPFIYDQASLFDDGRAAVCIGSKWGIIDPKGKTILPIEYDNSNRRSEAYHFHNGMALVEKDSLFGYCDRDGRLIIYPCFHDAYQFTDSLAPVFLGVHWGYIDTKGDFYIPPVFDIASPFEYGRATVVYEGRQHMMDTQGRCVKDCKKAPKSWRK